MHRLPPPPGFAVLLLKEETKKLWQKFLPQLFLWFLYSWKRDTSFCRSLASSARLRLASAISCMEALCSSVAADTVWDSSEFLPLVSVIWTLDSCMRSFSRAIS